MERSNFYFKAIYKGDEFPDEVGKEVLVADDLNEVGYVICFLSDGSEYDNMHDDDIENYQGLQQECEYLSDYYSLNQQTN